MELVIDDLSCRRGGRLVFQGLSARLDSGRALAVRGANGSGKSSLLRVLAGLVPAADGTACLGDADLRSRTSWQEQVAYA
ncbi:MAG: ATP-binding cassette domain-containing protein, partial [Pseudomonadota bacterium]